MSNTVLFPTTTSASRTTIDTNVSALSLTRHCTALEICDLVYGSTIPPWDLIERYYEPCAKYENPLLTATSRAAIADIHTMACRFSQLDVPKPVAILSALCGISREEEAANTWFKALSMRNEVTDVFESESFDHHRRIVVEHTLHVIILPGFRCSDISVSHPLPSNGSNLPISLAGATIIHPLSAQLDLRSIMYQLRPSLLHLRLPIITRLSFNDAGKITYHRDSWDVKDMLNLIPGMTLAQWITSRLVAHSIRGLVGASRLIFGSHVPSRSKAGGKPQPKRPRDEEEGLSAAAAYAKTIKTTAGIGLGEADTRDLFR